MHGCHVMIEKKRNQERERERERESGENGWSKMCEKVEKNEKAWFQQTNQDFFGTVNFTWHSNIIVPEFSIISFESSSNLFLFLA